MSLIKQLVEMDPFMGPIGGIVCPPAAATDNQPEVASPDRRERLLKSLMMRTQAEEEEEMGPDESLSQEEMGDPSDAVVEFIKNFDSPTEDDFEQVAAQAGMSTEELKLSVFDLAHAMLCGIGKHSDVPDDEFDPEELQKGIEVEMEHVNNTVIAKMIAKDHLIEIPDYYNRLDGMEQEGQDDQAQIDAGDSEDFEDDSEDFEDDDHDYGDGDTFGGEEDEPQDDEEEYR